MATKNQEKQEADAKTGTVIKPCSCSHGYQDKTYGKGNRVKNLGKKKYTCTVCGNSTQL